MKTVTIFVLGGALLGVVVASLIAPSALSWYSTPGGLPEGTQIQALVQIEEVIKYATGKLIRAQTIGGAIGAVIGLIGGIAVVRKKPVPVIPASDAAPPVQPGL
jgi:hypothetical protein